jgi:hypothetical protein
VSRTESKLNVLLTLIRRMLAKEEETMATIQDVLREVQETKGVSQSILVFIQGLKDQIQALIDAGAGATPEQLQSVVDDLDANEQALAAAMVTEPPTP